MFIKNTDEVIPLLRTRLDDYLALKGIKNNHQKKFSCFVHEDSTPSMVMNYKTNFETAHCFGCGTTVDIFKAAAHLDNLPESGAEWMTVTVPALAEMLQVPLAFGTPSEADSKKLKLYKLAQDIANIIESPDHINTEYAEERNWINEHETGGSIDEDNLVGKLIDLGWNIGDIDSSLMVRTPKYSFFGEQKFTFTIRDPRGRPVGFQSRSLDGTGSKYINTPSTPIFEKMHTLLGMDKAIKPGKHHGIYVVEGPGDRAQLLRLGVLNVVATMGTAFTAEHTALLKMHGIRSVYFCMDWDKAGASATSKIFHEALKNGGGVSCSVVAPPADMGENVDPDSYLKDSKDSKDFTTLPKITAFAWVMSNSQTDDPEIICKKMIPIIATEDTSVRREILIKTLQEHTGISYQSIAADVAIIRDKKQEHRKTQLLAATQKYILTVSKNPDEILSAMTQHEKDVERIEKEFSKQAIGVESQLSRYDAIQELKKPSADGVDRTTFKMDYFTDFATALSGGMVWTIGTVIYFGGRANSGKTANVIMLGLDVALSDPDAIVVMHYTDDSYYLIEPRLKTNIAVLINPSNKHKLSVGMTASPYMNIQDSTHSALYKESDRRLRELISQEKLIVIDSEDGTTLSVLERHLKHIRRKYPQKKILLVCDNTYNYTDNMHLQPTDRITQIANGQKNLTIKYRCAMFATAEYRKNMPQDQSKLKLPVNDDLADARAMMYRSNAIIHVYNDLKDRQDYAEFFHVDPMAPEMLLPRLLLTFGKNKITGFDKTLYVDLDPSSVTLKPVGVNNAKIDYQNFTKSEGTVVNGRLQLEASEWEEAEDARRSG